MSKAKTEYNNLYKSAYTGVDYPMISQTTKDEIQNASNKITGTITPKCNISFGNLGKFDFDFLNLPTFEPLEMKMFDKIKRLNEITRGINDRLISVINELECCGLGYEYNKQVLPIFEFLLHDFSTTLVDIAKGMLKAWQVIDIALCIIRPVPGNPWMKGAGYDWFNPLYSIAEGFANVFKWFVDGNPLDVIINPMDKFYKKLKSCVPLNKGLMNADGNIVFNDRFNEMLEVYKQNYLKDTTKSDQLALDARTTRAIYEDLLDRRNKIIKKLAIPTQGRMDEETADKTKEKKIIEDNIAQSKARQEEINRLIPKLSIIEPVPEDDILKLQEELDSISFTIESDESTYNSLHNEITALEYYSLDYYVKLLEDELNEVNELIAEHNSKYLALTGAALEETNTQNNNDYIIRKNLKQLAIEDNKPSCLCLLTLLGVGPVQIPEYQTIFYTSDLESVEGRVMYRDRTQYNKYREVLTDVDNNKEQFSQIYDDLRELIISPDKDFSEYKLNRNLMLQIKTLAAEGDLVTGDLNNTISYKSYEQDTEIINGDERVFYKESTKEVDIAAFRPGKEHLYTDGVFTSIPEVLEHNDLIYFEKIQISKELNIYKQDLVNTELKLRIWWENYRSKILAKIKYFKIQSIQNELGVIDNIINAFSEIISPLENAKHVAMLGVLGESYNPSKLMENYGNIIYYSDEQELAEFEILKEEYFQKNTLIKIHESLLKRLELKVNVNNVELELIGQLNICGCDLICKLIQYILDLIMSVIQAIIQIIVARIIQMIMNEYVTYVLRFIQEKMKCLLKVIYFKDQQELIEQASKSVERLLKAPLNEMRDTASCTKDEISELIEKLKSDEIKFNVPGAPIDKPEFEHTIPPDPTYGDPYIVEEPENVLINSNGKTSDLKTERNIPTTRLDCEPSSYLELEIRDRNKFEIMISFIPSEFIHEAEIILSTQEESKQTVHVNGEQVVLDDIVNPMDDVSKILEQVNEQVQNIYNSPKFIDQCGTSNTENTVLCNTDNLSISYLKQVDPNNQNNLVENNTETEYGKLYGLNTVGYGMEVFENFNDHTRQLQVGENYWRFEAPLKQVTEYTTYDTEEYIVQELGEHTMYNNGHIETDNISYISDFIKYYVTTTTTYTYVDKSGVLYEVRDIVKDHVEVNIFNHQHIELVGRFANTVNYLDIRILFSVVNYVFDQQYEEYYASNYTGRFLDYIELGGVPSADEQDTIRKFYNISELTLIKLSTNILRDNMIISEQNVMDQAAKDIENKKTDLCNVDTSTKQAGQFDQAIVDNIALSVENAKLELESFTLSETDYEIPSTQIEPLVKSVPLIILNDTYDISIEIVNKRIQLQMPTEMFYETATVIEHDLQVDKTYMLSFNTDGLIYKLKLITEEKEIFEASGINQNFYKLFPTKIGGDGNRTFCGVQILDIILSKLGSNTINYYIRSNLSYVPRNAQIVFDFKLYNGNQVFNTINASGLTYSGLNTSALQKADMYGTIIRNEFYQVMHGYMDNFFCKDNLGDKDFSISLWLYRLPSELTTISGGRQYIISDDVNNNYIYYFENQFVMDFNGQVKYAIMPLNTWTHITLRHKLYEGQYDLIIKNIDGGSYTLTINTKRKFFLMSLLARYSHQHRMYIDQCYGLLGPVGIFMYTLENTEVDTLFTNQNILVKGMQNAIN